MSISTSNFTVVRSSPETVAVPVSFLNPPSCLPSALLPTNCILVLSPSRVNLTSAARIGNARTAAANIAMSRRFIQHSPTEGLGTDGTHSRKYTDSLLRGAPPRTTEGGYVAFVQCQLL